MAKKRKNRYGDNWCPWCIVKMRANKCKRCRRSFPDHPHEKQVRAMARLFFEEEENNKLNLIKD